MGADSVQKWIVTLMCCALVFSAALADSDTRSQMDRGAGYTYIAGEKGEPEVGWVFTDLEPHRRGDASYTYVKRDDGTLEIVWYEGYGSSKKALDIPEKLWNFRETKIIDEIYYAMPADASEFVVSKLGNGALHGCHHVESIRLPNTLVEIEGNPFSYCYKLRAFELDIKHPTLRTVNGALVSRADGRLICYPCGLAEGECRVSEEISSIGDLAFYDCDRLTAVRLPAGLTAIGANPFRSCKNLAEIIVDGEDSAFSTVDGALIDGANDRLICYPCAFAAAEYCLPETIRAIGDYALYECAALTKVELPDGLKTIGNGAFAYCSNLQTIELPDGLTSIGDYAFSGCRNLYALRLPDGLKYVGEHAFDDCPNLTLVVSRGSRAEKYCKQHELDYAFAGEE